MIALQRAQDDLVAPTLRLRAAKLLCSFSGLPAETALRMERCVAGASGNCVRAYMAHIRRQGFNVACNANLTTTPPERLILMSDEEFAAGTLIERVQNEEQDRMRAYTELLKEKYENVVKAQSSDSILKCRACGSSDIAWSQKQTRGADESSTIFCQCQKCSKRWRLS